MSEVTREKVLYISSFFCFFLFSSLSFSACNITFPLVGYQLIIFVLFDVTQAERLDGNYSIYDVQRSSQVDLERQQLRLQQDVLDDLTLPKFEQAKRELAKKMKYQRTADHIPYKTIDVIFNDRHLYGNLQKADPELITYNFSETKRW